ncbi:MAG: ABC transporter substrate-binding protein [Alphaproteobacteria bacterium]|nr:ABC transporter substrate-binding protein [Alphaproteobacteria bacterium]
MTKHPFRLIALAAVAALGLSGAALAQGKYVHANNSGYDNLDPHAVFDVGRAASRINFYDGLYRWVDNPPKMIPWLAESHTVTEDGLSWTFKLRQGVKFHDGTEMTADDVVYSMERMLAMKKGPATLFMAIIDPGTTKAKDRHTVVFNLKEPSAVFHSTVPEILIVNSKLVKQNEKDGDWGQAWLSKNVASTGSYTLRRYDPAVGFVGARFKDHFAGWGAKSFDEIEFRTVLETNTRVLGLLKGDIHGTDGYLPQDQIARLRQASNVQIIEQESMRVFYFAVHNSRPPLNDVHLRRALSYAFDYDGFNNDLLKGAVSRNAGPVPNNLWGVPKDVKGYTYDLEKAKAELAKVKEPMRPIVIGTLAGFSETEQAATLLQNAARKIGIEIKVESAPWPVVQSRMQKEDQMYDMVPLWKSTYYVDPNNWIGEMYGMRYLPLRNNSYYRNPEVDKRLEQALKVTDQSTRDRLYQEAGRIVVDDAAGIFVYNTKWFGPYAANIGGIRFCPIGNAQDMRWAYFK